MSRITLSGNASGTGNFTIASPNSNTDRTLTLPDASGTVLTTATAGVPINGPAFSAYMGSNQTVTQSVWTKLQYNTEEFDTNSCYDNSTYRFTPTVAGYYQVNACAVVTAVGQSYNQVAVYKNGVLLKQGVTNATSNAYVFNVAALVFLNGTTDYIEIFGQTTGASPTFAANNTGSYFQAALVRAA